MNNNGMNAPWRQTGYVYDSLVYRVGDLAYFKVWPEALHYAEYLAKMREVKLHVFWSPFYLAWCVDKIGKVTL